VQKKKPKRDSEELRPRKKRKHYRTRHEAKKILKDLDHGEWERLQGDITEGDSNVT
jgi:hypothetical protein